MVHFLDLLYAFFNDVMKFNFGINDLSFVNKELWRIKQ
jgi:hypothetical protein